MSSLNPTTRERLVDAEGRPYFLWDVDMTLERFRQHLAGDDLEVRQVASLDQAVAALEDLGGDPLRPLQSAPAARG